LLKEEINHHKRELRERDLHFHLKLSSLELKHGLAWYDFLIVRSKLSEI